MMESAAPRVLVTGAAGFVAMHTIQRLLQEGYRVRGTLRTAARAAQVRGTLALAPEAEERLEFAQADLLHDEGWSEAVRGCEYVVHIASPYPLMPPKDENELIRPSRDGTLRILGAAVREGVRRIVFASSTSAITGGHQGTNRTFDETDWARLDRAEPYARSKTLAERAAWDFVNEPATRSGLELAVVNPAYVFGPALDNHYFASSELVRALMRREVPGVLSIVWPFVDVRDVAAAFLAAMTEPAAAGQRLACVSTFSQIPEIALILRRHFSSRGYRVPTREIPRPVARLIGVVDRRVKLALPYVGWVYTISTERIRSVLNWQPRRPEETLVAMAESLISQGLV